MCTCVFVRSVHDGYKVGSDLTITLEFRTSQLDAVFVGISSAKVDAIGLEMINGQVRVLPCLCTSRIRCNVLIDAVCFFFFRWCSMWTMEPDGCRFAPTVSCCATEGGTSCRPGKPNTAWAWAWMGEVILQRILTHSQPLLKPTTPCIWADSQVRRSADPTPRLVSICVRVQPTSSNFSWSLTVDVRQNCLSISSRFRGCLRNLQLVRSHMSNTLDLSSAHFLLGVTPYSCPAT